MKNNYRNLIISNRLLIGYSGRLNKLIIIIPEFKEEQEVEQVENHNIVINIIINILLDDIQMQYK